MYIIMAYITSYILLKQLKINMCNYILLFIEYPNCSFQIENQLVFNYCGCIFVKQHHKYPLLISNLSASKQGNIL